MLLRSSSTGIEVWAPAKLNLFLEILGKRPDGYHELETLMVPIRWFDTLEFSPEPSGEIELECVRACGSNDDLPADDGNIVVRAVRLLQKRRQISAGARIRLIKRIPIAAGLAGGSSDAAAALVGACRLWKIDASREELTELGAEVGSDVPFFFAEGPAICRGRGEFVEPVGVGRSLHVVVVTPHERLLTARVFGAFAKEPFAKESHDVEQEGRRRAELGPLCESLARGDWSATGRLLHNRLQAAAESLADAVRRLRFEFNRLDVCGHRMSGSGSSYFGLCRSAVHARRVAARLASLNLGEVRAVMTM